MEMKKRFAILSVVILAFLAVPLRASAASKGISGTMGGWGVGGFVEINASSAWANTNCQNTISYCKVSVTYYYVDETDEKLKSNSSSSEGASSSVSCSAGRLPGDANHVCTSYRATSTHSVSFGSYVWNPAPVSVDY